MAINKNSNGYTFLFAIIMVIVVGAVLSYTSLTLKPRQDENTIKKDMMSILGSIGVESTRDNVEEVFYDYVKTRLVLNSEGEILETREGTIDAADKKEPFNVDIKKEFRNRDLGVEDRNYPLYMATVNGEDVIIMPMVGKGLWGPIWGYVALSSDYNTIVGATFDHKTETPGLGAEIKEDFFELPFQGKEIYDTDGNLVSITITKGGADPSDLHAVDGITGGTITSNGVGEMLERSFGIYSNYFENEKSQISEVL